MGSLHLWPGESLSAAASPALWLGAIWTSTSSTNTAATKNLVYFSYLRRQWKHSNHSSKHVCECEYSRYLWGGLEPKDFRLTVIEPVCLSPQCCLSPVLWLPSGVTFEKVCMHQCPLLPNHWLCIHCRCKRLGIVKGHWLRLSLTNLVVPFLYQSHWLYKIEILPRGTTLVYTEESYYLDTNLLYCP